MYGTDVELVDVLDDVMVVVVVVVVAVVVVVIVRVFLGAVVEVRD